MSPKTKLEHIFNELDWEEGTTTMYENNINACTKLGSTKLCFLELDLTR
jgi:hypothetical protein